MNQYETVRHSGTGHSRQHCHTRLKRARVGRSLNIAASQSPGTGASPQELRSWRNSGTTQTPTQEEGAKEHTPDFALLLTSNHLLVVPCVSEIQREPIGHTANLVHRAGQRRAEDGCRDANRVTSPAGL